MAGKKRNRGRKKRRPTDNPAQWDRFTPPTESMGDIGRRADQLLAEAARIEAEIRAERGRP